AGAQKLVQIAWAAFGDDFLNLVLHDVFVTRKIVPRAEDAKGGRETLAMLHMRKQESIRGARMMSIVNNEIVLGDAGAKRHRFDVAIGLAANAFITVLAVDERSEEHTSELQSPYDLVCR